MLSFKKGNYSLEELQMLQWALADCIYRMPCPKDGCSTCKWRRVCDDLSRCDDYVMSLIQEKIEKSS